MASYSNYNYFPGVVVIPKLLTNTNKYKCEASPVCKDNTKIVWHLHSQMPYKHIWNIVNRLINQDVIKAACMIADIPTIAFVNIWRIAQFDWQMYPYISHELKLIEKELILDAFDIAFRARHGKLDYQQFQDFCCKIAQTRKEVRFFYFELNK